MRRLFAGAVLSAAILLLSGCYVDPGYSYVRRTSYQGDAYYGRELPTYDDGYYAAPLYDPYYGGGCCYAPGVSVGIGATWYGGPRYYRGEHPYRRYDRARDYRRGWRDAPGRANDGSRHADRHDGRRRSDRDHPRGGY